VDEKIKAIEELSEEEDLLGRVVDGDILGIT
jgi:hypothetical protein